MLKAVLTFCSILLLFSVGYAQTEGKVVIKANTEFSIQLDSSVYSDKNAVGDDIKFVLADDINNDADKIPKGSIIFARIVNIEKISPKNDTAKVCVMFDFIKKGEEFITLEAAIVSLEPNPEAVKLTASTVYSGGTTLSLKGKDIQFDKGKIFKAKVKKDITSN